MATAPITASQAMLRGFGLGIANAAAALTALTMGRLWWIAWAAQLLAAGWFVTTWWRLLKQERAE